MCKDLVRPCATNADCVNSGECYHFGTDPESNVTKFFHDVADVSWCCFWLEWAAIAYCDCLQQLHVFPEGSTCPTVNSGNVGTKIMNDLLKFWGKYLQNENNVNGLRFCGVKKIKDIVDGDNSFEVKRYTWRVLPLLSSLGVSRTQLVARLLETPSVVLILNPGMESWLEVAPSSQTVASQEPISRLSLLVSWSTD